MGELKFWTYSYHPSFFEDKESKWGSEITVSLINGKTAAARFGWIFVLAVAQ